MYNFCRLNDVWRKEPYFLVNICRNTGLGDGDKTNEDCSAYKSQLPRVLLKFKNLITKSRPDGKKGISLGVVVVEQTGNGGNMTLTVMPAVHSVNEKMFKRNVF